MASAGLVSPAQATRLSYLDNGVVKVGVDLDRGGMIVYLAPSGAGPTANLVDATTLGDGIQPWFNAGNNGFKSPAPPFESDPWNPSVGGDAYGHPSYVFTYDSTNDGTTIHTDTHPQQWALNDHDCNCYIEQWISLDGRAVRLRVRLTIYNNVLESFDPALRDEELPALHLSSSLNRLLAYTGNAPYSGAMLSESPAGSQRTSVTATESWAALVNAGGSGIGVFHPGITRYDYAAGFLAPVVTANLFPGPAWRTTWEDASTVVLGTVAEIRAYASAHHPNSRPDYQFTQDDSHLWTRWNASPPAATSSALAVAPTGDDPQLLGPDEWFRASDVPTLYVRGAWHTRDTLAQLFWRAPGTPFSKQRSVRFRVVGDGRMHTYSVALSGQPVYTDVVTQLRFDPVCCSESNSLVEVASISWRPDPAAIPVAIEHARQVELRLVRDRKHRLGAVGRLVAVDSYLPCIAHMPVRIQRLAGGTWVPVKTLYTGTGGGFSLALPSKSRSHYRAVADFLAQQGNTCGAIAVNA